jgi:hypothetical protein
MSNQAGFKPVVDQPRRWHVLETFMAEQGYKTFVEVGCREGRTTGHILKAVPDSRVIAIDPWMADPAPNNGDKTREDYKAWDFGKIEAEFWANVGEHKDRCTMLRCTSEEASKRFTPGSGKSAGGFDLVLRSVSLENPDNDLKSMDVVQEIPAADLVFIDALHDYESVKQDIALWWPKVRIGGMLCGHDFNHKWPGCERAVAESFDLMHIGVASDSVWFIVKAAEEQYRAS